MQRAIVLLTLAIGGVLSVLFGPAESWGPMLPLVLFLILVGLIVEVVRDLTLDSPRRSNRARARRE